MNELKDNKVKAELLAEFFLNIPYDKIIYHKDIENIIDCDHKTHVYGSIISKTKDILRIKHRKGLENVRGQGYRLVSPDDYTDFSMVNYRRGFNSIKKGKEYMDCAPTDEMSEDALATYRVAYDRVKRFEVAVAGVAVELRSLPRKPHPFAVALEDKSKIAQ